MQVVHISTIYTGGAGYAAFNLHRGLMKLPNVDSRFVQKRTAFEPKYLTQNIEVAWPKNSLVDKICRRLNIETDIDKINKSKIPQVDAYYEYISFPESNYRLENYELIKNADIINLHWVADFLNYPTFFKKIKRPIVWTLHDMNPFSGIFHYENDALFNQKYFGKLNEEKLNLKLKSIHKNKNIHIVSPSSWLLEKSKASSIFRDYPHTCIPNGFDLSTFLSLDRRVYRDKLGINNGLKTILFVASDITLYRKGFDLLLGALEKVKTIQFNFITVGGLDNITINNNNINLIHFNRLNNIDELNAIYSASDITVLASREDNLPNVMLESLINGTPIICFANGGMKEHIQTGINGIVSSEITSDSLAGDIMDFLNNKYTFHREQIRNYGIQRFDEKQQADSYLNLYQNILNTK